jgi:hypothetical protein
VQKKITQLGEYNFKYHFDDKLREKEFNVLSYTGWAEYNSLHNFSWKIIETIWKTKPYIWDSISKDSKLVVERVWIDLYCWSWGPLVGACKLE